MNIMAKLFKKRDLSMPQVGIQIDGDSLKAVKFNPKNMDSKFESYEFRLDSKIVSSGYIVNEEALIDGLKTIVKENKWHNYSAITTILSRQIIVRHLELPIIKESDLNRAIKWEIAQQLPYDAEDAVIDYCELSYSESASIGKNLFLFAAAPRDLAITYNDVFKSSGLNLNAIDVLPSALRRWLIYSGKNSWPDSLVLTICVVDITKEITTIIILRKGKITFARTISLVSEAISKKVAGERLNKDTENKIEILKFEIKKTIDYYRSQFDGEKVGRIILTGVINVDFKLLEYLEEFTNIPVCFGNIDDLNRLDAQFATASGLALKGVI